MKCIDSNKEKLHDKINNLTFYRNVYIYLTGGYAFATFQSSGESIINNLNFSEVYIPIILGSTGIMIYSFNKAKETNYKLKKVKTELSMVEFKESVEEGFKSSTYLLKK